MPSSFFSIILPTYNRANMLPRAIESVLNQKFTDWELIIVDDASTDNTEGIIKKFNDERIRYFRNEKNIERSASRNRGITEAKGKYICFLDSDDYYLREHLSSFYEKIKEQNFPVAMFYCNTFEERDGELLKLPFSYQKTNINIEFVLTNIIGIPRTCLHKSILEKYKFNPEYRIGEDLELWTRILKEYPLIPNNQFTIVYTAHENRTVHLKNEATYLSHLLLIKRLIRENKNYISSRIRNKVMSNSYYNLSRHYIYKNKRIKAFITLLKSIFICIKHPQTKHKLLLLFLLIMNVKKALEIVENK